MIWKEQKQPGKALYQVLSKLKNCNSWRIRLKSLKLNSIAPKRKSKVIKNLDLAKQHIHLVLNKVYCKVNSKALKLGDTDLEVINLKKLSKAVGSVNNSKNNLNLIKGVAIQKKEELVNLVWDQLEDREVVNNNK